MLSQAHNQQEYDKHCEITATADENKNPDEEDITNMEIEQTSENAENEIVKQEKPVTPTATAEPAEKSDDTSKAEDSNSEIKSKDDEDEENSKGIDIDPKTYCKLGHFHLLLEDYAKGEYFCLNRR